MNKIELWMLKKEWLWITVKYEFGVRYDHLLLPYCEHSCGNTKREAILELCKRIKKQ